LLESLLESGAVATAAVGVDEDDHGTGRGGGILAVSAVNVAGLTGGGVLKTNGIAHCVAQVPRHG